MSRGCTGQKDREGRGKEERQVVTGGSDECLVRGASRQEGKVPGAQVNGGSGDFMPWGRVDIQNRRGIRPRCREAQWPPAGQTLLGYHP